MRAAPGLLALAGVAAAALALLGCERKTLLRPNVPPETLLFVQGPVDTVGHHVHLYWFGTDPDGDVEGYEWRFKNPLRPADTLWAFTDTTDRVFTVFDSTGTVEPTFEVRAIDDQGERDPSPALQRLILNNQPPTVAFTGFPPLPDTTFASATITWSAYDNDGDAGRMSFLVWLDGNETTPHVIPPGATSFTFPTADFGSRTDTQRTAHLMPVDDGGLAGPVVSYTWYVRSAGPDPRLLLIDDVPSFVPAAALIDSLYNNGVARGVPAGSYALVNLERLNPFRSAQDVEQTFKLFRAVLWYRETNTTFSTLLQSYQPGIEGYLGAGGNFYLSGLDLIAGENATGPLTVRFALDYLGCERLHLAPITGRPDSTASWGITSGRQLRSTIYQDSLRSSQIYSGLRGFAVRDTAWVAFWARDSVLTPANGSDVPVAVQVPQASGGKAIVFSFPLRGLNGFGQAHGVLARVLRELGAAP